MILAIEILFLIAGLYATFTAKLPSWFVGKGYKAEGSKVRLLGILMAATLPIVFCGGFVLGVASGIAEFDPTAPVTIFEIGYVIIVAIIVTVVVRNIRVPESTATPPTITPPGQSPLA